MAERAFAKTLHALRTPNFYCKGRVLHHGVDFILELPEGFLSGIRQLVHPTRTQEGVESISALEQKERSQTSPK